VPVEIEFEPDESPEQAWPERAGAPGAEQLGGQPAWRASVSPVRVPARLAVAGAVLAAACASGFMAGQTAQRDRHAVSVHLAASRPLVIDPVPDTSGETNAQLLATPWTGAFDRAIALRVVNDGPDPVTLLGGTLTAAQISPAVVLPAGRVLAPGAAQTLRARAHFDCVEYPQRLSATDARVTETAVHLGVRTADGAPHQVTLLVDALGTTVENDVCSRIQNPGVFGPPAFGAGSAPGSFSASVPVVNRAPFPLRVNLNQQTADSWMRRAGLIVTTGESVIPARTERRIEFTVRVTDCALALHAAASGFRLDTLVFTDARLALNSPFARQFGQAFAAAPASGAIARVCRSS
jgi:hypothetical protein